MNALPPPLGLSAEQFYATGQASGGLPMMAISIKQPWSWLICAGYKDVENRDWRRTPPSRALIHAGLSVDKVAMGDLTDGFHPVTGQRLSPGMIAAVRTATFHTGGFVGVADFTGAVVETSDSPWFMGRYGYMLRDARPLPFLAWRGQLGFFRAPVLKL